MLDFVRLIRPGKTIAVPSDVGSRERAVLRELVKKYSRGNYRLRAGRYVTASDIKRRHQKLADEKFAR
jgi:hypothetical protein